MDTNNNKHNKLKNLYNTLGVDSTATNLEVRDAYLKLAAKYHPDKNPEGKAKFIDISSAYQILTNPERREQFINDDDDGDDDDSFRLYRTEPDDRSFEVFTEILTESLRRDNAECRLQKLCIAASIGLNVYTHQSVSLEDIYLGQEVTVKYTRMLICQQCQGHGNTTVYVQCIACQGAGHISVKSRKKKRRGYTTVSEDVPCKSCAQKGRVREYKKCNKCHGNQYVEKNESIQVQVPMGGPTDGKIRIARCGHETYGEEFILSDLIVLLHLRHHPRLHWKVGTSTLVARVPITLTESLLGLDRVVVEHLDGRNIKVSQPGGKVIRPGTVMRIPGEGMRFSPSSATSGDSNTWMNSKAEKATKSNGDLLVEFDVQYPDKLALPAHMAEQLRSIFSLCVPSEHDSSSFHFEQSADMGSFLSCPAVSSSPDKSNNGNIVERVMVEENLDIEQSEIIKKMYLLRQDGFCPICASKPLFDEKMFKNMAKYCCDEPDMISLSANLFDYDIDGTVYDDEEEYYDLYS